jgi:hypothetical protein
MALIRPTDITLGRGPAFYNHPGNRLLRKLLKENAVRYRHEASRREKTEMITLLVSQLEAKGCRFLHLSSTGAWVEAPSRIIIKKVGHGLRDARLAVAKNGGSVTVIPKNFRPSLTEEKQVHQVTTVFNGGVETTEDISDNTNVITINAVTSHSHANSTKLQTSLNDLMASSSVSTGHLIQGGETRTWVPIPETGQQLIDAYMHSFSTELLGRASQQSPPLDEKARKKAGFSFFDGEMEDCFGHWDDAGHINSLTEPSLAHPTSTSSNAAFDIEIDNSVDMEHLSERSEGWHRDMNDILGLQNDFPNAATPFDIHVEGDVDMVMKIDGSLGCEEPFNDCLVEYPSQSVGCSVHDEHSIRQWFHSFS